MNILKKYLDKYKVKEFSELSDEEKQTYREWNAILNGRKLTDEDVATFLNDELEDVLGKLPSSLTGSREDLFLKMKLEFIRKIQRFLKGPEIEKEMLEQNINQLMN